MKVSEILGPVVLGAGLLVCSFAVLAFLAGVMLVLWSLTGKDPGGPMDPGDAGWRLLGAGIGMVSVIAGMIGYMLVVISKNLEKKATAHFDANSNKDAPQNRDQLTAGENGNIIPP